MACVDAGLTVGSITEFAIISILFTMYSGCCEPVMHELVGDGAEAEVLLPTGKEISYFQRLPVFAVVFISVLGTSIY
jgi:hypothetical protein